MSNMKLACYSCLAIELCLRDLVLPLGHPEPTCAHRELLGGHMETLIF